MSKQELAAAVVGYISNDGSVSITGEHDAAPTDVGNDAVLKSVIAALVSLGLATDDTTQA
jgi:hypothetical protein